MRRASRSTTLTVSTLPWHTLTLWRRGARAHAASRAARVQGKYVVRLHFNGVWRKVVIDDRLPYSAHGELLCSHSKATGELWVSLLEKAFLKVGAR